MRLICPNCSAQYEVDDSVIPETGRDVQCSACGRTWFQPSRSMLDASAEAEAEAAESPQHWEAAPPPSQPDDVAALPDDFATGLAEDYEAEYETEAAPVFAPPPEEPAAAAPADDAGVAQAIAAMLADAPIANPTLKPAPAQDEEGTLAAAPMVGATPRRPIDDSLLSILREEAEREAAARRAEGGTIETQEEMNLEPDLAATAASRAAAKLATAAAPAVATRPNPLDFSDLDDSDYDEVDEERVADLTEGAITGPAVGAARRPPLPDIEEINSSLRASADRAGEAAAYDTPQFRAEQRSGFRRGFFSVIALAVVLAALYLLAPRLSASVPALAPALEAYVNLVNDGRLWLDGQLRAAIERFTPATN